MPITRVQWVTAGSRIELTFHQGTGVRGSTMPWDDAQLRNIIRMLTGTRWAD